MIKMGQAVAYDFKVFLPTLCILGAGLSAVCKVTGHSPQSNSGSGPTLQLGG